MKKENTKTFKAGSRIVSKGDAAVTAWLIVKGKVKVSLERDGRTVRLAELGPGAIFGETALLGGGVYGAHVDAETDVELAPITPESFAGKLDDADPMLRSIVQMMVERLQKTNEALLNSETREFMDIEFI